jgi:hypothetical protein
MTLTLELWDVERKPVIPGREGLAGEARPLIAVADSIPDGILSALSAKPPIRELLG